MRYLMSSLMAVAFASVGFGQEAGGAGGGTVDPTAVHFLPNGAGFRVVNRPGPPDGPYLYIGLEGGWSVGPNSNWVAQDVKIYVASSPTGLIEDITYSDMIQGRKQQLGAGSGGVWGVWESEIYIGGTDYINARNGGYGILNVCVEVTWKNSFTGEVKSKLSAMATWGEWGWIDN